VIDATLPTINIPPPRDAATNLVVRLRESFTCWTAAQGMILLRLSIGLVFFWFGALKLFPPGSTIGIAIQLYKASPFQPVSAPEFFVLLATAEALLGLCFIFNLWMRVALIVLLLHMLGTLGTLFVLDYRLFVEFPAVPNLQGMYVLKNFVIIASCLVLYAAMRRGVGAEAAPDSHSLALRLEAAVVGWLTRHGVTLLRLNLGLILLWFGALKFFPPESETGMAIRLYRVSPVSSG